MALTSLVRPAAYELQYSPYYRVDEVLSEYIAPEQYGEAVDGADHTAIVQAAFTAAAAAATTSNGIYVPKTVFLSRNYTIKSTLTLDASKVRVRASAGAGLYFDATGSFTSNRCISISGTSNNAAYVGQAQSLFDGVVFTAANKTLDLFYVVRNSSVSGDNGACLHNITGVACRGFNRIFTHGSGGWGWSWYGCQFSSSNMLMQIITASDTYERHSFFGCTWQNGGYAFNIANPDGKVYWHGGSIDYSDGLATISAGHLEASGHNEWTARTLPLVNITGSNASVVVSGTMFLRNNSTSTYYIFNQYQRRQVALRDTTFVTDGTNLSYGLISNLEVLKSNLFFTNDAGKSIAYNSSDENLISGSVLAADYSLTSGTSHTVSIADGVLTATAVSGGVSTHLYIDIPVVGCSKVAFKMIASNGSSSGAVFLNKSSMTLGKVQIENLSSSGTTQWAANATNVAGGSVTVFDIPKTAGYLRLDFNLVNLAAGTSFSISSLKMFSY